VDACISGHIKLEHVITCTFGCTNGEMHVESFSDEGVKRKRKGVLEKKQKGESPT
jgi:hypothetical protein